MTERFFNFTSAGTDEPLRTLSFRGTEAVARPFRFDLDFYTDGRQLDLDALIGKPATLEILRHRLVSGGSAVEPLPIHGMISEATIIERRSERYYFYKAVLVPRLWRLTRQKRCRVFLDKTTPAILESVLTEAGFAEGDYEFRTTARTYPTREYTVQYGETDLDFLNRLCEHEGISYFFQHGDDREKAIFTDTPEFPEIAGEAELAYKPHVLGKGMEREGLNPESVRKLTCTNGSVYASVLLNDYNWRTPSVDLTTSLDTGAPSSYGTQYEYGDHYKSVDDGKALAGIRAEEAVCRRRSFEGASDVRSIRAGATFTLAGHFVDEYNASMLLVEVRHEGSQPTDIDPTARIDYSNSFTAIPASVKFRPARTTPKPRISGTLTAVVDASGDGEYAEIDADGRYKVALPFDQADRSAGQASRYIRMMQPYAGQGMGMHFPLHKGTEVALVHVNGDPDRPLIAGAVPNAETPSPVTSGNQTQCAISTSGGNHMKIENQSGRQKMSFYSPVKNTGFQIGHTSR